MIKRASKLIKQLPLTPKRLLSLKTTINPTKSFRLSHPSSKLNTVLVLTTPNQLNTITDQFISLSQLLVADQYQTTPSTPIISNGIVVCVDSILQSKNAISELWFDSPNQLNITNFQIESDNDTSKSHSKSDDHVNPIKLDNNWKDQIDQTEFKLSFTMTNQESKQLIESSEVTTRLGRSLFANGLESTCFFSLSNNKKLESFNFHNLRKLGINISLPTRSIDDNKLKLNSHYTNQFQRLKWEDPEVAEYVVTSHTGNLIKTINFEPASQYLIDNPGLNDSKDHLIYVKLNKLDEISSPCSSPSDIDCEAVPNHTKNEYYKIIVGGSGWDPEKKAMLGIDPIVGEGLSYKKKIELYEISRTDRNTLDLSVIKNKQNCGSLSMIVECTEPEETFHHSEYENENVIDGVFGFGSYSGFNLDGVWHKGINEIVEVDLT